MIVVITNRQLNPTGKNKKLFGESYNNISDEVVRVATAKKKSGKWKVELQHEDDNPVPPYPSEMLFRQIMKDIADKNLSNRWLFHVHGHNTSFGASLEQAHQISKSYKVNVVLFSWPSNPGPDFILKKKEKYRRAQINARKSSLAFDRVMEKLHTYFAKYVSDSCTLKFSFMAYSQGNYVAQSYITNPVYDKGEMNLFDNIIFCQADVDAKTHASWTRTVEAKKRIYVTINEHDNVLNISNKINPKRLGHSVAHIDDNNIRYIDFTDGKNIKDTHRMFDTGAKKNSTVKNFFQAVLTGHAGENTPGLVKTSRSNLYELDERVNQWEFDNDY